ncbi:MAG: hypothetical protein Q9219_004537 [cf. Caloplaca sp. 3 TL-2023]
MDDLGFSDENTEALFASPSRPHYRKPNSSESQEPTEPQSCKTEHREVDDEEPREAILRKELAGIRTINQVFEGAIESLEHAGKNMDTVSRTVTDASALLHTWTRILSQTEHNQRLILDPSWRGATQDITEIENEVILRRQEKARQELEESHKRDARARKAEEEEERKRVEHIGMKTPRGSRSRGRVTSRGRSSGRTAGYGTLSAPLKDSSSKAARAGSSIGRGWNGHRGRSRDL